MGALSYIRDVSSTSFEEVHSQFLELLPAFTQMIGDLFRNTRRLTAIQELRDISEISSSERSLPENGHVARISDREAKDTGRNVVDQD
jgi:hypothetical protein